MLSARKLNYLGNDTTVETLSYPTSMESLISEKIAQLEKNKNVDQEYDDPFFIGDLGDIVNKLKKWKELLPRVEPFYAVKCNPDHAVVKLLADLGTGFDCASKTEIEQILNLGVSPSRIIYANPCKQASHIRFATKHKVHMMTFDNEAELYKIKELFPKARLVLRILPTANFKVQCELGNKFGCHPAKADKLFARAKELGLKIIGISFHVGSGVGEAAAFSSAVQEAHDVWQLGKSHGFKLSLLDVGGGFPGQKSAPVTFYDIAKVLNESLDRYFPAESGVSIIAEPGRFFVASAFTLAAAVVSKRVVHADASNADHGEPSFMYYINDGVYGSFNCILYDHATVEAKTFIEGEAAEKTFTSTVFGPTCDGLDTLLTDYQLPELQVADWLYFPDMGAYTMCAGSTFNGMPRPKQFFYCRADIWDKVYTTRRKRCESTGIQGDELSDLPLKTGHDLDVAIGDLALGLAAEEDQPIA